MSRSISQSCIILILLLISTIGCVIIPPGSTVHPTIVSTVISSSPLPETLATPTVKPLPAVVSSPPAPDTLLTPSDTPLPASFPKGWKTYLNQEYGFSFNYPAHFEITPYGSNASLFIGEQIHVWIS